MPHALTDKTNSVCSPQRLGWKFIPFILRAPNFPHNLKSRVVIWTNKKGASRLACASFFPCVQIPRHLHGPLLLLNRHISIQLPHFHSTGKGTALVRPRLSCRQTRSQPPGL